MSQVPVYPNIAPGDAFARIAAGGIPGIPAPLGRVIGPTFSPLTVRNPDVDGRGMGLRLLELARGVSGLGEALAAQERMERELQEKNRALLAGEAETKRMADRVQIAAGIEDGSIFAGTTDEETRQIAQQLVRQRTEGTGDVYTEEYSRRAFPDFYSMLSGKRLETAQKVMDGLKADFIAGMVGVSDAAEIEKKRQFAVSELRMTDHEALGLLVNAAQVDAVRGYSDAYGAKRALLEKSYPLEVSKIDEDMSRSVAKKKAAENQVRDDELASLMTDAREGRKTFDAVRVRAHELYNDQPQALENSLREIQAQEYYVRSATDAKAKENEQARQQTVRNRAFTFNDQGNAVLALGAIDDGLADGSIDAEEASRLRAMTLDRARARLVNSFENRVDQGLITAEQLEAETTEAIGRKEGDPLRITADDRKSLLERFGLSQRRQEAEARVTNALNGGRTLLTPNNDSPALSSVIRSAGLIDQSDRIINGAGLAATLGVAGFVPADDRQVIEANLRSDSPLQAALTVGTLGDSPTAFATLTTDDNAMVMETIRDEYRRGTLTDPARQAGAIQRIRDTMKAAQEAPSLTPEQRTAITQTGVKLAELPNTLIDQWKSQMPYAEGSFLTIDPAIDAASGIVSARIQRAYTSRYFALQRGGMPMSQIPDKAMEYAKATVQKDVDLVRWNGLVNPVLVDEDGSGRLPESLRWGPGSETEAKADLEGAGFSADQIATLRPALDLGPAEDGQPQYGWYYITTDGDILRDDAGNAIIYQPTDTAIKAAEQWRQTLRQKADAFVNPAARWRPMANPLDSIYSPRPGRNQPQP